MLALSHVDSFYDRSQILHDVCLDVPDGEVTAVLGRNGTGKTTLLKTLMGLTDRMDGEIRLDATDIGQQPTFKRARAGIAYVPQGREIFPLLTVKENLETGFAPLKRRERFVPDELFDLFPVLKSMLGRRGGDLSGGQQQQLAIARALVTRPKLLVLDEPTEGIQPSIIKDIGRAIDYLRQKGGMAIVLVEQYFDFARDLADTMFVMDRGEVVLSGPMSELDGAQVQRLIQV
jgi:urea transport system ATP-binding protein